MEYAKVIANENIIDQFNNQRLIEGKEYMLFDEEEDEYFIKDETGRKAYYDKRHFSN